MQCPADMPALVLDPEKEHDDRGANGTHHRMVEHLHSETPFPRMDLLVQSLHGYLTAAVAGVAHEDV
jgi:hypothetical protein